MTPQEAYDITVKHLRTQKVRAVDSRGFCKYRVGRDGPRCAIGVHMTEEHAPLDFLGDFYDLGLGHPEYIIANAALVALQVEPEDGEVWLGRALQIAHDTTNNWSDDGFVGEAELERIARGYGLVYTPPN